MGSGDSVRFVNNNEDFKSSFHVERSSKKTPSIITRDPIGDG